MSTVQAKTKPKKKAALKMPSGPQPSLDNKVAWIKWYRANTGALLSQAMAAYNIEKAKKQKAAATKKAKPKTSKKQATSVIPNSHQSLMWDADPRPIGQKVGLRLDIPLSQHCAEFYVLEWLWTELSQPIHWDENGRVDVWEVIDWGMGTKTEWLAIEVKKAWEKLLTELAPEIALYSAMACGGELRHLPEHNPNITTIECKHFVAGSNDHSQGHVNEEGVTCCIYNYTAKKKAKEVKNHHEHYEYDASKDCKKGGCQHKTHDYKLVHGMKMTCDCPCDHNHIAKTCKLGLDGCAYTTQGSKWALWQPSVGCCKHKHPSSEEKHIKQYEPTPRIKAYFDEVHKYNRSRAGGWGTWYHLFKRDKAKWMYDCAEAHNHPLWGGVGGFGGPRWGLAAQLTADYYAGLLKPRTFLDRCWSLQHNGGSLFNKAYNINGLKEVLERQAHSDYQYLVDRCRPYVQGLWYRNEVRKHGVGHLGHAGSWLGFVKIAAGAVNEAHTLVKKKLESWSVGKKPTPSGFRKFFHHIQHNKEYGILNSKLGCLACISWFYIHYYNQLPKFIKQGLPKNYCGQHKHDLKHNPGCIYASLYKEINPNWKKLEVALDEVIKGKWDGCVACRVYGKNGYSCSKKQPFNVDCMYSLKPFQYITKWYKVVHEMNGKMVKSAGTFTGYDVLESPEKQAAKAVHTKAKQEIQAWYNKAYNEQKKLYEKHQNFNTYKTNTYLLEKEYFKKLKAAQHQLEEALQNA